MADTIFSHAFKAIQDSILNCLCNEEEETLRRPAPARRPLLPRSGPPTIMPMIIKKKRTYGTRRAAVAVGAAAIFGGRPRPIPEEDLLGKMSGIKLSDSEEEDEEDEEEEGEEEVEEEEENDLLQIDHSHLGPLIKAYRSDTGFDLPVHNWQDVLPEETSIIKIAEASFAEVYRISSLRGSSIIKVMQLKHTADPISIQTDTAIAVGDVVSEIRIMNAMTEVPGFVVYKQAYLVEGPPPLEIHDAYDQHIDSSGKPSYFPHPKTFTERSTFLIIELGDAGQVLEDVKITTIDQIWDVFLGTVIALSRAEQCNEFEHRDLHENNICVHKQLKAQIPDLDENIKFGHSGLLVTLIDYGLSRAKLDNGDIAWNDLEHDLELFRGDETGPNAMQFNIYRRMRTHLFTSTRTLYGRPWHTDESRALAKNHTWMEYMPYSNVLWISYILSYLVKNYKKHGGDKKYLAGFEKDAKELKKRLDTRTKVENGAFTKAGDVLEFVYQQGWVNDEQLGAYGVDTTIFTEDDDE